MTTPDLSFESIEIRRMPGFPKGGLALNDLCPGVNIIYGPNASGKTTLGRAIHGLLNPSSDSRIRDSLRGCIRLNGTSISIDCDFGSLKCQNLADGSDIDRPQLAPAETRKNYVLALHDLVNSARDHDLAKDIGRELSGGYDVAQASQELGFQDKASAKRKTSKDHIAAKHAHREAQKYQLELLEQQTKLARLREEKENAYAAVTRLQLLEKASEYLDAHDRYEQAKLQVAAYPEGISKISGHEIKEIDRLKGSIDSNEEQKKEEQRRIVEAQDDLISCNLPNGGIAEELIGTLRRKSQRLNAFGEDIRRAEGDVSDTQAELDAISKSLGPKVSGERSPDIDTDVVQELFKHVTRFETLRAEQKAAQALSEWLGAEELSEDPESLREGAQLLHEWVAVNRSLKSSGQQGFRIKMAAAGAVLLASLLMGFLAHASWFVLSLMGAGLIAWAFWPSTEAERTSEIQRNYESLGVGIPKNWSDEDVRKQLRDLQDRRDIATLNQKRRDRWGYLSDERKRLAKQAAILERKRQDWVNHVGIDTDEATLSFLVTNLAQLHKAQQQLAVNENTLSQANQNFTALCNDINRLLSPFGIESSDDPDVISERIEDLSRRQQRHISATRTIHDSTANVNRLDEGIRNWQAALDDVYASVGLTASQESTLRRWTGRKAEYDVAVKDQSIAEAAYDTARNALTDSPELLELSREDLITEQHRCREQADRLSPISEEIGGIENAIQTAREGNDLAEALANEMACADELREQRDQDCDAVIGNVLVKFIDRQERDSELPVILRRARELFSRITHGRYELHVQPGERPEFRALETAGRVGLGLEELSSGTRLQLLLAARLAFVERQEQGIKLPLIFDETLGNSDERRATEIIDAAIEFCRQGRQIFYFTAQYDEVAKWKELLKDSGQDLQHKIVDLAEERQFSESERIPLIEHERPKPVEIPAPEGVDWITYGQLLRVPRLQRDTEIGDCHLWYLIDDVTTLYRLLNMGINKWGQLQSLVLNHRVEGLAPDSEQMQRAKARERLLKAVFKSWNVGRGKPVDRAVLMQSGAISETYLDRVSDLTAELQGDAKQVVRALDDGELKGFRTEKRQDLEEYLIQEGYIDDRDVLTLEEIRDEARLAVFKELDKGLIERQHFEVLVNTVVGESSVI